MSRQLPASMYVHIPFCIRKCLYCDFNSYAGKEHLFTPYVEALRAEIRLVAARFTEVRISTVYFGGGTPNILTSVQLGSILEEIRRNFRVDEGAEISIESNPASSIEHRVSSIENLAFLGFNRLSLGVQSFSNEELQLLGRTHTAEEATKAFNDARAAGFDNISIDLMYGIPGQTRGSWKETLHRALELSPEHISLYSLTVEEGTPFFSMQKEGKLALPDEDTEADMYEESIRVLTGAGYEHYEISNLARPGFECQHNMTYWRNESYFGFGAGATSFLNGLRATSSRSVEEYIRRIETGEDTADSTECLVGRRSMGETMFLGLRMLRGVNTEAFRRRYGLSPKNAFPGEITDLADRKLIEQENGNIRLSRTGLLLANEVFAEFVD